MARFDFKRRWNFDSGVRPATTDDIADLEASLPATYASRQQGLQRRQRLRPRPQETVFTTFASGHGWTATGFWQSSNLNDTTDQAWSTQCVSGVAPGTDQGCNFNSPALTAFDPTGKHFCVMAKIDNPANLGVIQLFVGADSGMTNANVLMASYSTTQMKAGEWFPLVFSADGATTNGTGAGTAAAYLRLRVTAKNGSSGATFKFGGVSRLSPSSAFPNGVVSFTFDDSYASHYTIARPVLNKYRYRATLYPILDLVGTSGRLTTAQMYELADLNGWEVGGHASTLDAHTTGLVAMTEAQRNEELQKVKAWMVQNGLPGDSFAYPQNLYDTAVSQLARSYFSSARTTEGVQKETLPPAYATRLRARQVQAGDTAATLQAMVDAAYTHKHHLIFCIHDIVASGATGGTQMNRATFEALVDYCATKGIPVLTVDDVLGQV